MLIIGCSVFVVVDIQSVCMVWSGGILNWSGSLPLGKNLIVWESKKIAWFKFSNALNNRGSQNTRIALLSTYHHPEWDCQTGSWGLKDWHHLIIEETNIWIQVCFLGRSHMHQLFRPLSFHFLYLLLSAKPSGWVSFPSLSCRHWSPSQSLLVSSSHPDSCFSSFSSLSWRDHLRWIAWWLPPQFSAARQTCSPDSSDTGPTGKHTQHI